LNKTTFRYDNNTVTANLLPLYFNMVPSGHVDAVFNNIVDKIEKENNGHISTGVVGGQWLMEGLTKYGRADLALRIASNDDYPSWGYMLKEGATTIWELWNGNTANPAMNSHNHIMLLGDLITWLYKDLAGIASLDGGYRTIYMNPSMPDSLNEVEANYQTPYGIAKSSWKREEGMIFWDITIPPNTSGEVHLPTQEEEKVQEGGSGLRRVKDIRIGGIEARRIVLTLGAGTYHFKIQS
jgi:alpha-L-rhamnosidase